MASPRGRRPSRRPEQQRYSLRTDQNVLYGLPVADLRKVVQQQGSHIRAVTFGHSCVDSCTGMTAAVSAVDDLHGEFQGKLSHVSIVTAVYAKSVLKVKKAKNP